MRVETEVLALKTKVVEVDGDMAVIIPTEIMKALNLNVGDILDVVLEKDGSGWKLVCRKWLDEPDKPDFEE